MPRTYDSRAIIEVLRLVNAPEHRSSRILHDLLEKLDLHSGAMPDGVTSWGSWIYVTCWDGWRLALDVHGESDSWIEQSVPQFTVTLPQPEKESPMPTTTVPPDYDEVVQFAFDSVWATLGVDETTTAMLIAVAIEQLEEWMDQSAESNDPDYLHKVGRLARRLGDLVEEFTMAFMWPDSRGMYPNCRHPYEPIIQAKMSRHDTRVWLQELGAEPWRLTPDTKPQELMTPSRWPYFREALVNAQNVTAIAGQDNPKHGLGEMSVRILELIPILDRMFGQAS